jgi:DNA helicase IV
MREIDLINEDIRKSEIKKQSYYSKISLYKKEIIEENKKYIGRYAIVNNEKYNELILKCNGIICADDFSPIFMFGDKKYDRKCTFVEWK